MADSESEAAPAVESKKRKASSPPEDDSINVEACIDQLQGTANDIWDAESIKAKDISRIITAAESVLRGAKRHHTRIKLSAEQKRMFDLLWCDNSMASLIDWTSVEIRSNVEKCKGKGRADVPRHRYNVFEARLSTGFTLTIGTGNGCQCPNFRGATALIDGVAIMNVEDLSPWNYADWMRKPMLPDPKVDPKWKGDLTNSDVRDDIWTMVGRLDDADPEQEQNKDDE